MICKNCGAQLRDDAVFCGKCGARTSNEEAVEQAVPAVSAEDPVNGASDQVGEKAVEVEENIAKFHKAVSDAVEKVGEEVSTMPAPEGVKVAEVPETVAEVPEAVAEKETAAVGAAVPVYTSAPVQTAVHTPAPAEAPVKKPKAPKKPIKHNGARITLSILLSILLCVSLLAASLVTVVKLCVTEDNLESAISSIQFSSLSISGKKSDDSGNSRIARRSAFADEPAAADTLGVAVVSDEPHVASLMSTSDISLDDIPLNGDINDLADYLYDLAKDQSGWENVKKEDIQQALDHPLVDEFMTEMAGDYTDVIVNGEDGAGKGLTPENITDFVMEHEEEIKEIVEDVGYQGEFNLDRSKLETTIRDSIGDTYSPENIAKDYSEYLDVFRLVVSTPVVIGLWALTALLIVLLIVVNRRRVSAVLSCVGIPALIVGIIYLAAWGTMSFYPDMKEGLLSIIPKFLGKPVLLMGAGLAGGGIILIIIKIIVRSVQKKRRA